MAVVESALTAHAHVEITDAKAFAKALTILGKIVPRNAYRPALGCFLVRAGQGRVTVTATNLQTWATVEVEGAGEGAFLLPKAVAKTLPKTGSLTLEVGTDPYQVQVGGLTIASFPVDQYPAVPGIPDGEQRTSNLSIRVLADIMAKGRAVCAVGDTARPLLTGVAFLEEGQQKGAREGQAVATNGFQVYYSQETRIPALAGMVLQADIAPVLSGIAGLPGWEETTAYRSGQELVLEGLNFTVTTRLLEGAYPRLLDILPADYPMRWTVLAQEFTEALADVANLTKDYPPYQVTLTFDGDMLQVTAKSPSGNLERSIHVDLDGSLEYPTVAFNARQLKGGLATVVDKQAEIVTLEFSGPGSIMQIHHNGAAYMQMPLDMDA